MTSKSKRTKAKPARKADPAISRSEVETVAIRLNSLAMLCARMGDGKAAETAGEDGPWYAIGNALDHAVADLYRVMSGGRADPADPAEGGAS